MSRNWAPQAEAHLGDAASPQTQNPEYHHTRADIFAKLEISRQIGRVADALIMLARSNRR